MKKTALLRAYPKDTGYAKLLVILSEKYVVDCFLWDREGDYRPFVEHENITYKTCRLKAGFYNWQTLLKLILFEIWLFFTLLFTRCDYIHAIDLDTGLVGWFAARLRGKKFIYHCFDPYYAALPAGWPGWLGNLAKRLEAAVIAHADLFIVTDKARLSQHGPVWTKKVAEIANVPYYHPPEATNNPGNEFMIGYIGSLVEGRNLRTIIETAGTLKDHGITLVIGGFGPLERQIRQLSENYENVVFTGWVPHEDLPDLESRFDVFIQVTDPVSPSQKWVSPNKLFTSMAYGRPIIVGEGTLAADRVESIGNGVAVPYGSKAALQHVILALSSNQEMVEILGNNGRKLFDRHWRLESMKKRLLEAYRDIG